MNIIHPNGPMRGVERESCFLVKDDAGVELGQGSIIVKPMGDVLRDQPLSFILSVDAHPAAMDMLYGALMMRARVLHQRRGHTPTRVVVPCALTDSFKRDYFLAMGFDDTDGEELFRLTRPEKPREMPPPLGTGVVAIPLRTQADTEQLVARLNRYTGEVWSLSAFEQAMNSSHFLALAIYSGSELCGEILISGEGPDAMIEGLYALPGWRRKGVAMALLSAALHTLMAQGVQYLYGRAIRRNRPALSFLHRTGFEWIMTRELLLGRNLNLPEDGKPAQEDAAFAPVFSK